MATLVVGAMLVLALALRRDNCTPNRLLAGAIVCVLFRYFALMQKAAGSVVPVLMRATFPTALLAPALFFLYVCGTTTPTFRLTRKHAVHLLPCAFGLAWYLSFQCFAPPAFFRLGPEFWAERYARLFLMEIVEVPYLVACLHRLWTFEREAKNHVADLTPVQLNWLRLLLTVALGLAMLDVADLVTGPAWPLWQYVPDATSISVVALGFYAVYHSSALARELALERQENSPKATGTLSAEELSRHSEQLLHYLEKERPFLNPELRLSTLAMGLGLRPNELSEVIKRGLGSSFYDLINGCRVEAAKELIADPQHAHLSLFGIALDSGFKAKSVFNKAFKERTRMTPSEYRASCQGGDKQ